MAYKIKLIEGKKCYLSPMDSGESNYSRWLNEEEILMYLRLYWSTFINPSDKESLKYNFAFSELNFAIINMEDHRLIGNCGFGNISDEKKAEAKIFIGDKDFHDNGYGIEALCLLLDYGFRSLNIRAVSIKVYEYNTRTVECYMKIGFKINKDECGIQTIQGEKYRVLHMDITYKEFYKKYIRNGKTE